MADSRKGMSTKLMIIIVLGLAFIAGYFVARERYKPQINNLSSMVIERDDKISYLNNLRNRLILRDGQLIQNNEGEIVLIEDTFILTDGSRVSSDGIVTRPNGDIENLSEGDSLFLDGTIVTENELDKMNSSE